MVLYMNMVYVNMANMSIQEMQGLKEMNKMIYKEVAFC